MSKRLILIAVILAFSLALLNPVSAEDKNVYTTLTLDIKEDLTFDFSYSVDFDSDDWFNIKRTFFINKEYSNVRIYDSERRLKIVDQYEDERNNNYVHTIDYGKSEGRKRLYINATGKLYDKGTGIYHWDAGFYSGAGLILNSLEKRKVILRYPRSMKFISASGDGLESVREGLGFTELNYGPEVSGLIFTLSDKEVYDSLLRLESGKNVFFVQNDSLLEQLALESIDGLKFIMDFPREGKVYVLFDERDNEIAEYERNRVVFVNKSYLESRPRDKVISTVLHELTHYAVVEKWAKYYPEWLDEGVAVYTEIKFLDEAYYKANRSFEDYYWDDKKIEKEILYEWYGKGEYLEELDPSEFEFKYDYYGFLINYFAKTYGEDRLRYALSEIQRRIDKSFIDPDLKYDPEATTEEVFVELTGSKENLFFPKRSLFLNDKEAFDREFREFYVIPEEIDVIRSEDSTWGQRMLERIIGVAFLAGLIWLLVKLVKWLKRKVKRLKAK